MGTVFNKNGGGSSKSKSRCVYLGTGTSFDIKSFIANSSDANVSKINYQALTNNNFFVEGSAGGSSSHTINYPTERISVSVSGSGGITKSYNATNGMLSSYAFARGSATQCAAINSTGNVKAYLILPS